jgi:hypothetical protein
LFPTLVLLAEFILAMEAAHILLVNFTGPIITLLVKSCTIGNAHKIKEVSAVETSKFEVQSQKTQK